MMKRIVLIVSITIAILSSVGVMIAVTMPPSDSSRSNAVPNLTPTVTPLSEAYLPALFKNAGPTQTPTPLTVAVIGDYGVDGPDEAAVATQVATWQPQAILTLGDNNYPTGEASTIDQNIGKYYHQFIAPYSGSYGTGAITNAFFPALGNHDWVAPNAAPYLDYFTLPNNERYYSVRLGDLEVFVIDSDPHEPDGISATSTQAQWLQSSMTQSDACWKIVTMHHAPYSSSNHGSTPVLQWPYATWGADVVLAGHDHIYERLAVNGLPYIVNGLGGNPSIYSFNSPLPESIVRYNAKHGAQRLTVTSEQLRLEFINRDGTVIDTLVLDKTCP